MWTKAIVTNKRFFVLSFKPNFYAFTMANETHEIYCFEYVYYNNNDDDDAERIYPNKQMDRTSNFMIKHWTEMSILYSFFVSSQYWPSSYKYFSGSTACRCLFLVVKPLPLTSLQIDFMANVNTQKHIKYHWINKMFSLHY